MPSFSHSDPGYGYGGPRYPGTFLLALRAALAKLQWRDIAWKGVSVECADQDGISHQIGLENLYRRLRREPRATWTDQLAELLGSVPPEAATPPAHLSDVASQLLVRLGPPFKRDNPETDVWTHPLVDQQLTATLVIDYPSSMSYVTEKMIADSGQAGTYWLQRALDNLTQKSAADGMHLVHGESGLLQAQFGDAYDSSRALLLDHLLPGHEENGFFVVVPGRDHLLVLPLTDTTLPMAPWLRAIAAKTYQEMPYPISPELYWWRRGVWHHFAIEIAGEELMVNPPAEFIEVMARLRSVPLEQGDDENDAEPPTEGQDPVSF